MSPSLITKHRQKYTKLHKFLFDLQQARISFSVNGSEIVMRTIDMVEDWLEAVFATTTISSA
jgi:hypothetical protein